MPLDATLCGLGVAVGCLLMGGLVALSCAIPTRAAIVTRHAALLLAYGTIMMGVCALACIGPLLRVFRVEPTDLLRRWIAASLNFASWNRIREWLSALTRSGASPECALLRHYRE